jgi:Outer membrane efflux protein
MKNMNTNRACGLIFRCLSWVSLLLYLALLPSANAQEFTGNLTLKKAVSAAFLEGGEAEVLASRDRQFLTQIQQREKSRIKHTLSSRTGISRNEIGDSQDLESSANETASYTLSYEQIFEGGISWKISQTSRSEEALTDNEEDEEYSKQLFTVQLPIYGKEAERGSITGRKNELELDRTRQMIEFDKNLLQISVARAFFLAVLQEKALEISNKKLTLLEEKQVHLVKTPSRITKLEKNLFNLDLEKEKNFNANKKHLLNHSLGQLALYFGNRDMGNLTMPEKIPDIDQSEEQALQAYLENDTGLTGMKNRLNTLQQDLELSRLATVPEIHAGGFVGNTNVNDTQGSNYGLNLSVIYRFGGGEEEAFQSLQQEINSLNLKINQEKKRITNQFHFDSNKFRLLQQSAELAQQESKILQKQFQLTRKQFEIGEIEWDDVVKLELSLLDRQLSIFQTKIDCWEQFLNVISSMKLPLIEFL